MHDETTTEGPHEEPTAGPSPDRAVTEARARGTRARARTSGDAGAGASEATSSPWTSGDAPAEAADAAAAEVMARLSAARRPALLLGVDVTTSTSADPVGAARAAERLGLDFVSASDHPVGTTPSYETWTLLS